MIALLIFSYACCALGVWFGWYLRGRREQRGTRSHGKTTYDIAVTGRPTITYEVTHTGRFLDRSVGVWTHAQDSTE